MPTLSRFHDLKVATKIGIGFASVLSITAVLAYTGDTSLLNAERNIEKIAQRVMVADLAQSTEKEFLDLRREVREFSLSGDTARLPKIDKEASEAIAASEKAYTEIKNPERHELAKNIREQLQVYTKNIQTLIAERKDLSRIFSEALDPAGQVIESDAMAVIGSAVRSDNMPLVSASASILEQLMLARLNVNKHFGRHDERALEKAQAAFAAAESKFAEALSASPAEEVRARVDDLKRTVASYQAAVREGDERSTSISKLVDQDMHAIADAISDQSRKLVENAQLEEKRVEHETLEQSEATRSFMLWLSLAGIALGVGLAWWISTGISGPVRKVADVLRDLAAGNLTVMVPFAERGDEVGENARSAQFFKEQLIEAERVRQEQARAQAQREERQRVIEAAVRKFEREIERVVGTVTDAAQQLEDAATKLTSAAGNTQQLSTAVAAASEQTSVNVQGVAAASEELAATVGEIGRQVQESSNIAMRAVDEAASTNSQVTQLSEVANRIGDVVNLINNIAGQTNLLALNATIEAARAGEAGKGFAVVAQEVKALAGQTEKATNEIAAQISSMQVATGEAVTAIQNISGTIGRISEITVAIAAAVEEQDATTKEISRNVVEAAKGTSEVASNVTDVSHRASETGAASMQVLSSAQQLAQESSTLKREVSVFLEAVRAA